MIIILSRIFGLMSLDGRMLAISVLVSRILCTTLSFSPTCGGIGDPLYETPLRVVIALASFLGFGMVLLGKELELEG
ncbi:hypothetical protein Tco_1329658 [Tanacetum coccineum]